MRKATSIILPGCSLLCRRLMVCAGLQLSGFRARRLGFVRSPKSGRSHTPRVTLRRRSRIIEWHGTQILHRADSPRRFPLYGVEAGGLSTNMKAHSMHFTGANGEGTSVSSVSSCSTRATVEPILRSFGCRASARRTRPSEEDRVEGTTDSCLRDFPAAEHARNAKER